MWNMFKVNNKDQIMFHILFLCFYYYFEQVIVFPIYTEHKWKEIDETGDIENQEKNLEVILESL